MGMSDRVRGMASNVQDGMKSSMMASTLFGLRSITGILLGVFLGLIFQELMSFGPLALTFFTLVVLAVFMRISSSWTLGKILVFDLICILVAQLLRMYILLAP